MFTVVHSLWFVAWMRHKVTLCHITCIRNDAFVIQGLKSSFYTQWLTWRYPVCPFKATVAWRHIPRWRSPCGLTRNISSDSFRGLNLRKGSSALAPVRKTRYVQRWKHLPELWTLVSQLEERLSVRKTWYAGLKRYRICVCALQLNSVFSFMCEEFIFI